MLPGFPIGVLGRDAIAMTAHTALLGNSIGYVRAGGTTAPYIGGASGGALSATLLSGYVTDAVISWEESGVYGLSMYFVGNATAQLAGLSGVQINGVLWLWASAAYDAEVGMTLVEFTATTVVFALGQPYTLELVFA